MLKQLITASVLLSAHWAGAQSIDITGSVTSSGSVTIANDYKFATPKAQTVSISQAAFTLASTSGSVEVIRSVNGGNPIILRTTGGTTGTATQFVAPVSLPDGADVKSL